MACLHGGKAKNPGKITLRVNERQSVIICFTLSVTQLRSLQHIPGSGLAIAVSRILSLWGGCKCHMFNK
jgi:hypothetical protein